MSHVAYDSFWVKRKDDDLWLLDRVGLSLNVGTKYVEIVSKGKSLELFAKWHFSPADALHRHLIIEVNVVISALDDVGVVVGVLVDGTNIAHERLKLRGDYFHIGVRRRTSHFADL